MSKVIYKDKECEVISVKSEWSCDEPYNTWFLINYDGYLIWVDMFDCKGC